LQLHRAVSEQVLTQSAPWSISTTEPLTRGDDAGCSASAFPPTVAEAHLPRLADRLQGALRRLIEERPGDVLE
jgi:hypothetical protein